MSSAKHSHTLIYTTGSLILLLLLLQAAFLFGASIALEVFDDKPEFVNALALARQYLSGAKQAAAAMQSALPLGASPTDPKADVYLLLVVS